MPPQATGMDMDTQGLTRHSRFSLALSIQHSLPHWAAFRGDRHSNQSEEKIKAYENICIGLLRHYHRVYSNTNFTSPQPRDAIAGLVGVAHAAPKQVW